MHRAADCVQSTMRNDGMNQLLACTKLFMGLQAMEHLLGGGNRVRITRTTEGNMVFGVYPIGDARARFSVTIRTKDGMTESELNTQLDIVWGGLGEKGLIMNLRLAQAPDQKPSLAQNGNDATQSSLSCTDAHQDLFTTKGN